MNQKEETRKRLEEEIFKSCKRENRNPDSAEIAILSNIEDQSFLFIYILLYFYSEVLRKKNF